MLSCIHLFIIAFQVGVLKPHQVIFRCFGDLPYINWLSYLFVAVAGFPGDIFGDMFGGIFGGGSPFGGSPFGGLFGGGMRGGRHGGHRKRKVQDTAQPLKWDFCVIACYCTSQLILWRHVCYAHTPWANKKCGKLLLSIFSPIIYQFSVFFHWHTLRTVCFNVIIIYFTTL